MWYDSNEDKATQEGATKKPYDDPAIGDAVVFMDVFNSGHPRNGLIGVVADSRLISDVALVIFGEESIWCSKHCLMIISGVKQEKSE